MDDYGKKIGGGIIAAIALVVGILFMTGVIKGSSGIAATILKIAGIGCIVVGVALIAIIVAVIVAAVLSNKPSKGEEDKLATKKLITERKQQLSKVKSKISILSTNIQANDRKLQDFDAKIEACTDELSRARMIDMKLSLENTSRDYHNSLNELNNLAVELESEILQMSQRRDNALAKMTMAEVTKNTAENLGNQSAIEELENKAQYQQDYANAMKELNGR